jgi:hypothetical protein
MVSKRKSFRKGSMECLPHSLCSGATLAGSSAAIPQRPGLVQEDWETIFEERKNLSSTVKIRTSFSEREVRINGL